MKTGTKSLLFGVHQVFWHPLTVCRAWTRLYGCPTFREMLCIVIHDWGYWGAAEMDGADGAGHPELGASIAGKLFDAVHRDLVLLHSRRYAKEHGLLPSKLCWADKLSIAYDPEWFYLLRARASGELHEYRRQAQSWVPLEESDRSWLRWIKARFTKSAVAQRRKSAGHPRREVNFAMSAESDEV